MTSRNAQTKGPSPCSFSAYALMPSGPAKMVEFPSRWTTTNRTMHRPVTATTAFLPIESESSRMSPSLFRGFSAAFGVATQCRNALRIGRTR